MSLTVLPPTGEESEIVHDMYRSSAMLESRTDEELAMEKMIRMRTIGFQKTLWTHYQERNIHGKLYGGNLIREAFELAFITVRRLCRDFPVLLCVDDIMFIHPVEIGSVVVYNSSIQYTTTDAEAGVSHLYPKGSSGRLPVIAVRVQADVMDMNTGRFPSFLPIHPSLIIYFLFLLIAAWHHLCLSLSP